MNKKTRDSIIGIIVVLVLAGLVLFVVSSQKSKGHRDLARRIASLSSSKGGPPETIEGLKEAIAAYQDQIELNVKEGAQTGVYWKILAIRLADRGMHRDALDALERALYYNTEDPTLFFLTGEYASIIAASSLGFSIDSGSEKQHYQNLAESAYLRAIQLDDVYYRPLLGLAMLYVFDLDRSSEAIPLLERYMQLMSSDIQAMFVLARAYYVTENYNAAVELYDRIISASKDPAVRAEAQNNKDIVRNQIYE